MSLPQLYEFNHSILLICLSIHCLFGASVFWIVGQHLRHRRRAVAAEEALLASPLPPDSALPQVLIQLPTFNEGPLIGRITNAVANIDWPHERLHVQILDDSTDGSLAHSERAVTRLRDSGIKAELLVRSHRDGFKAGALAEGLLCSNERFVAILDADYVPEPDFLRCCMRPLLMDSNLCLVQARCDYLNGSENVLTYAQQRILDGHFAVEQTARNWSGHVMPFNGTCGIWRRDAIDDAGGWQGDTLAEDLDLSYRAQIRGWRTLFLASVAVRGELPTSLASWRVQQFRWTKGFAEVGRKLLGPIWRSRLSLSQKLISSVHLGSGMLGPLLALTLTTALIEFTVGRGPTWPVIALAALSLLEGVIVGPALLFLTGQILLRRSSFASEFSRLPTVLCLQIVVGLANFTGALEALFGLGTPFQRTPKDATQSANVNQSEYAPGARS
jgi:cellulose synthase/poly-beta-1,6-N-acetylglucosamine synthase-like glycosyltransferase